MSIKYLHKWQVFLFAFLIALFFFVFGAVFATFLYMKNIDIFEIRKRQAYLVKEVEELKKERRELMYIFKERGLIKEHNKQAIIKPEKEIK